MSYLTKTEIHIWIKTYDFRKNSKKPKNFNNINISINNNYLMEKNDNINSEREEYKFISNNKFNDNLKIGLFI